MFSIDLDSGFRQGAFDIALAEHLNQYIAAEIRFVDEGKQPTGIKNVNRPLNLDGVVQYPVGKFTPFIKAGLTSSYFSHNGSGNGFKNNTGFTGVNYGAGLSYKITDTWAVQAQLINMNYQQSDHAGYESFLYGSVGVRFSF